MCQRWWTVLCQGIRNVIVFLFLARPAWTPVEGPHWYSWSCISRRKCDFLGNSKKILSNPSSESNSFTSHTIQFVNKPPFRPARLQKTKSESVLEFYRWPNRLFLPSEKEFKISFSCINIKENQVLVKSDDINVSKSSQTCQLNSVPQWMNK